MKLLTILGFLLMSNILSAQEIKLNKRLQEIDFNSKILSNSYESELLKVLLNNTDNIQLKDGTIIRINNKFPTRDKSPFDEATLEKIERELKVISGGGTGGGG